MIKTALVAMVVIGCDCDQKLCEFISQTPPQYASVSECEAALRHNTLTNSTMDYPLVTGICKEENPDGTAVVTASAEPQKAPVVAASAAPVPPQPAAYSTVVSGGRSLLYRTADGYIVVRDTLGRAASGTADIAMRTGGKLIHRIAQTF